jgi:DNA-binding LytR/AlgR family response regulator
MINAIIIEDEKAALENLENTFKEVSYPIETRAVLPSVRQAIDYFSSATELADDIIFSDVQLGDGLSFTIFKEIEIKTPVVFVTGYDQFMMNAFEHNGIDYLLKPVDKRELSRALLKYHRLQNHFSGEHAHSMANLFHSFETKKPSRMVVQSGSENILLKFEDIVLFYTENKVVYVRDNKGRKYLCDKKLSELEQELDPEVFFRANRQYIVNIEYIKSYKPYEKVKLQVGLSAIEQKSLIIISQEVAPLFRKWVNES